MLLRSRRLGALTVDSLLVSRHVTPAVFVSGSGVAGSGATATATATAPSTFAPCSLHVVPHPSYHHGSWTIRFASTDTSGSTGGATSAATPPPPPIVTSGVSSSSSSSSASTSGTSSKSHPKSGDPPADVADKTSKRKKQRTGRPPVPSSLSEMLVASGTNLVTSTIRFLVSAPKLVVTKTFEWLRLLVTDPKELWRRWGSTWAHIKEEARHYWLGSKLLWADVNTSSKLMGRVLGGHMLSRRERQQLLRTAADVFRIVPMSIFVLVPFMELLLPVALRLFPNMLPSTFQSSAKSEEKLRQQLKVRLDMAWFLQDAVNEMAKSMKKGSKDKQGAQELLKLLETIRNGEDVQTEQIVACARLFNDEITLDNISRPQLVAMSKFLDLNPYLPDGMLRFQIRSKIRNIKTDDQAILFEGVDSLQREELRRACAERGMRAVGLSDAGYRRQLRQWLDLSINREVPTTLLILSRAFTITASEESVERALQESISSFDTELVTEAVLENATRDADSDKVLRELRLESVTTQNELIQDEREEEDAAKAAAQALEPGADGAIGTTVAAAGAGGGGGAGGSGSGSGGGGAAAAADAAEAQAQTKEALAHAAAGAVANVGAVADGVATGTTVDVASSASSLPSSSPPPDVVTVEDLQGRGEAVFEQFMSDTFVVSERATLSQVKRKRLHAEALDLLQLGRMKGRPEVVVKDAGEPSMAEDGADAPTDSTDVPDTRADEPDDVYEDDEDDAVEVDLGLSALQSGVDHLLEKIEHQLEDVEKDLGQSFDTDKDGFVTLEEIEAQLVARGHPDSAAAAAKLIDLVPVDETGKVAVKDLKHVAKQMVHLKEEWEANNESSASKGSTGSSASSSGSS